MDGGLLRSTRFEAGFPPLPETLPEADAVVRAFTDELGGDGEARLLSGQAATRAAFLEQAASARFLHVATHAFFAPESVPSALDDEPLESILGTPRTSFAERVAGLAPLTLCGLALAGAGSRDEALDRVGGVVTAEELAALDLSGCELAVLSACETSVGRRDHQGIFSLQTALHAAGARTAVTSLWRVPDRPTRLLMEAFYRGIWGEQRGRAEALWRAKRELHEAGEPLGHWAGWVLSGAP